MSIQHSPKEQGKVVASRMGDRRESERRVVALAVIKERRVGESRRGGQDRRRDFLPK